VPLPTSGGSVSGSGTGAGSGMLAGGTHVPRAASPSYSAVPDFSEWSHKFHDDERRHELALERTNEESELETRRVLHHVRICMHAQWRKRISAMKMRALTCRPRNGMAVRQRNGRP
jgi:hypothetical protein